MSINEIFEELCARIDARYDKVQAELVAMQSAAIDRRERSAVIESVDRMQPLQQELAQLHIKIAEVCGDTAKLRIDRAKLRQLRWEIAALRAAEAVLQMLRQMCRALFIVPRR